MKNWLRNWLQRLLNSDIALCGSSIPMPNGGGGLASFHFYIMEAQNGWVIHYSKYDSTKGSSTDHARITETMEGVNAEISSLLAQHSLRK